MEDETSTTVVPKTTESIIGWLESAIITSSQSSVGQALFKLIDSFLWVIEKCAQWSLPTHETVTDENGKVFGKIDLVRPLPWVLFLPGLVLLRMIRCGLNVGAFILRYPQIQPSGVVKFVQKGRRRLRAMNLKAIKSRRKATTKDKRLSMIEAKKALIRSIKLTLSTLSCLDTSKSSPSPPPTKIRISHMDLETTVTPDEKSTTESVESPSHHDMKRKYSQVSSDDGSNEESDNSETLEAKLDRLAMNTSTEDPDFEPNECVSTDSSTASSENELDKEVPIEELAELRKEMKEIHKVIDTEIAAKDVVNNEKVEWPLVDPEDEDRTKSNEKKSENTTGDMKRVDSTESESHKAESLIQQFINGEKCSASQPVLPEASLTSEVANGLVSKKQERTVSASRTEACVQPQARTSISKENSSNAHERKGNKHRKASRKY